MTYTELEQRLGYPLGESNSSSATWNRFPQNIRRDGIREAERQLALDLDSDSVPRLGIKKSLAYGATLAYSVQSDFTVDLELLPAPVLRKIRIVDGRRILVQKPASEIGRRLRYRFTSQTPYFYEIEENKLQLVYPGGQAYNAIAPVLYYVKEPQTAEQFVAGQLFGGPGATTVIATWTAVNDGAFTISIDGSEQDITALDFSSGVVDMEDVAGVIQTGLRAIASGGFTLATCVWDEERTRFKIQSGTTSGMTSVSFTSTQGAGTDISGAGGTAFMEADSAATDAYILEGNPGFEYGSLVSEIHEWEESILLYATAWCLRWDTQHTLSNQFMQQYMIATGQVKKAFQLAALSEKMRTE